MRLNKPYFYVFILFLISFQASPGPGTSGGPPRVYIDPAFDYKVIVPENWTTTRVNNNELLITNIKTIDPTQGVSSLKIKVLDEIYPEDATQEEKVKALREYIDRNASRPVNSVTINGMNGFNLKSNQNGFRRFKTYLVWKGVVLKFTGLAKTKEAYELITNILNSTNLVDKVFKAVKLGNIPFLKRLYNTGYPLHLLKVRGVGPFSWAIKYSQFKVVELLVANGQKINESPDDFKTAVRLKSPKIAIFLINKGYDFNSKTGFDFYNDNKVYRVQVTGSYLASRFGKLKILKALYLKGDKLDSRVDLPNNNYINNIYIALKYNKIELVSYLISKKIDITAASETQSSLDLLISLTPNNTKYNDILNFFLKNDATSKDLNRLTHSLAFIMNSAMKKDMVEQRLQILINNGFNFKTLVTQAIKGDYLELVKRNLPKDFVKTYKDKDGHGLAFYADSIEMFNYLKSIGLSLHEKNNNNESIFFNFIERPKLIKYLISNNFNINMENKSGNNILHLSQNSAHIKSYIALGANPNHLNAQGLSPLTNRRCHNRKEILQIWQLTIGGAHSNFKDQDKSFLLDCLKNIDKLAPIHLIKSIIKNGVKLDGCETQTWSYNKNLSNTYYG
jgi:ankyrin repeat protein